jgi:hypothetical protein
MGRSLYGGTGFRRSGGGMCLGVWRGASEVHWTARMWTMLPLRRVNFLVLPVVCAWQWLGEGRGAVPLLHRPFIRHSPTLHVARVGYGHGAGRGWRPAPALLSSSSLFVRRRADWVRAPPFPCGEWTRPGALAMRAGPPERMVPGDNLLNSTVHVRCQNCEQHHPCALRFAESAPATVLSIELRTRVWGFSRQPGDQRKDYTRM